MFLTLICQYLNKLVESKVRDFASPEAFHAIKIQRLGDDGIKPLAQISGEFPMPIFALVGNLPIEERKLTDTSPPITGPPHLARKCLVASSEFRQSLFQEVWRLYFFAYVQCQIGIQSEVYPDTLTCRKIGFSCRIIGDDIQPIGTNGIAQDLDIADVATPLAMVVIQDVPTDKNKLLFLWTPFFERETDSAFREFVTRLELRRAITPFAFKTLEVRQAL